VRGVLYHVDCVRCFECSRKLVAALSSPLTPSSSDGVYVLPSSSSSPQPPAQQSQQQQQRLVCKLHYQAAMDSARTRTGHDSGPMKATGQGGGGGGGGLGGRGGRVGRGVLEQKQSARAINGGSSTPPSVVMKNPQSPTTKVGKRSLCGQCQRPLAGRVAKIGEVRYHASCLRCPTCNKDLLSHSHVRARDSHVLFCTECKPR